MARNATCVVMKRSLLILGGGLTVLLIGGPEIALGAVDTTPPNVSIVLPVKSVKSGGPGTYVTDKSALMLSASAKDNVGVTSVTWNNDANGHSGSAVAGYGWIAKIPLTPGDNLITYTAQDAAGNTGTDQITVTCVPAPTHLTVSRQSVRGANVLQWQDNSPNESAFEIEWAFRPDFSGSVAKQRVGANVTEYYDGIAITPVTYYYRVRAVTATGASGYSNTASLTVLPAPSELTVVRVPEESGGPANQLQWQSAASHVSAFEIQLSATADFADPSLGLSEGSATTFMDNAALYAGTYYYRVRATNTPANAYSDYSETVSLTVPTPATLTINTWDYLIDDPNQRVCIRPSLCQSHGETTTGRGVYTRLDSLSVVYENNPLLKRIGVIKDGATAGPNSPWLRCFTDKPGTCEPAQYPPSAMPLTARLPVLAGSAVAVGPPSGVTAAGQDEFTFKTFWVTPINPSSCQPGPSAGQIRHSQKLFIVDSYDFGGTIGVRLNVFVLEEVAGYPAGATDPWKGTRLERYWFDRNLGMVREDGWEDRDCRDAPSLQTCDGVYDRGVPGNSTWRDLATPHVAIEEYCAPGAASMSNSRQPIGYFDIIDANGVAKGWALDPDMPLEELDVLVYVDGPAGGAGGILLGSTKAKQPSPDVTRGKGYLGNHRFSFVIPPHVRDGKAHALYVYAADTSGKGRSALGASPRNFTLMTSTPLNDTIPPTVAILAPVTTGTYVMHKNVITLAAAIADNVGLTSVSWTNSATGQTGPVALTPFGGVASNITLNSGPNLITYTALDAAGNTGTDSLTVIYSK